MNIYQRISFRQFELPSLRIQIPVVGTYIYYICYKHIMRTERNNFLHATFDAEGRLFDQRCEEDGADTEAPQYTDNFSIDTEAVTAFAEQIQAAVAEKNLEALADLASYPLYIGFSDGGESVESREDLIALEADRIFSEELVSEIAGADPGGLAPSKAGFALSASGRPNVVFSVVDGRLAIVGINY